MQQIRPLPTKAGNVEATKSQHLASIWQVFKTEDLLIGLAELGGRSNVQIQSSVV
jgi:hypothetical protein